MSQRVVEDERKPVRFARIRRIWRMCDKWLVHVWLGFPLVGGLATMTTATSQYADIAQIAEHAPRIIRDGMLDYSDVRHRTMRLKTKSGSMSIACDMSRTKTSCIYGYDLPIKSRISMFDYKGQWIATSIYDFDKQKSIIDEPRSRKWLRIWSKESTKYTPAFEFIFGFMLAFTLSPIGILYFLIKRYFSARAAKKEGIV